MQGELQGHLGHQQETGDYHLGRDVAECYIFDNCSMTFCIRPLHVVFSRGVLELICKHSSEYIPAYASQEGGEGLLGRKPGCIALSMCCRGTQRLLDAALSSSAENGSAAELGSAGVASALPPRYVEFKEAIRSEMLTIKQKMGELRALHGKAALTSFDDSGNHEMDIEVLTQDITRLFRKAEVRLRQFGEGGSTSEADEKVGMPCISHSHHQHLSMSCQTCLRASCHLVCDLSSLCRCKINAPVCSAPGLRGSQDRLPCIAGEAECAEDTGYRAAEAVGAVQEAAKSISQQAPEDQCSLQQLLLTGRDWAHSACG